MATSEHKSSTNQVCDCRQATSWTALVKVTAKTLKSWGSHVANMQSVGVTGVEQTFLEEPSHTMGNHTIAFHFTEP